MDNKRVLYIGGFDLPDKNAAAQRVIANSKIFLELGYRIFLVGLTKEKEFANHPFEYQGFWCLNLNYPETKVDWMKYILGISRYINLIEEINPNLIIAYNYPAVALKRFLQYGKRHNIKVIADCTEWYQPQGNMLFRAVKGMDVVYRMKCVHPQLDGMIVISDYLNNFYRKKHCKVLLLPPLVDKQDVKWKLAQNEALSYRESKEVRLLYAGSPGLGNKDRLDLIIRTLQKIVVNNSILLRFDIIGVTEKDYKEIYGIKEDNLTPSFVHFWGRQRHQDVLAFLGKANFQIFVRNINLANTAGFPTKFVESISSKVLVLTNYSSDLQKYLIVGKNGFNLDISSDDNFYRTLLRVLVIPRNELKEMQSNIDSEMFDYRKYVPEVTIFMSHLMETGCINKNS